MTDRRLWPADPRRRPNGDADLLPAREGARTKSNTNLSFRPEWLRVPLIETSECCRKPIERVEQAGETSLTKLPAEAYAIIEGRHSDPFRYLGLAQRRRPDAWCALSFPRPRNVEAIGEHGEDGGARAHSRCRAVRRALPNGSKRYQLRARFGENVVDLDDPYRFPPVLSDFDLLSAGRRHPPADLRQARRASDDAGRRSTASRSWCSAPNAKARQRGRRFQFLESAAASDARARRRLLGAVRAACAAPATVTSSTSPARTDGTCR